MGHCDLDSMLLPWGVYLDLPLLEEGLKRNFKRNHSFQVPRFKDTPRPAYMSAAKGLARFVSCR